MAHPAQPDPSLWRAGVDEDAYQPSPFLWAQEDWGECAGYTRCLDGDPAAQTDRIFGAAQSLTGSQQAHARIGHVSPFHNSRTPVR